MPAFAGSAPSRWARRRSSRLSRLRTSLSSSSSPPTSSSSSSSSMKSSSPSSSYAGAGLGAFLAAEASSEERMAAAVDGRSSSSSSDPARRRGAGPSSSSSSKMRDRSCARVATSPSAGGEAEPRRKRFRRCCEKKGSGRTGEGQLCFANSSI